MLFLNTLTAGPYNTAFTIAALVALGLAHRAGRRDRVPPLAWAVVLAAALGGAIIGSKLIFLDFQSIAPGEKTVLGGIILGVGAAVVVARLLRLGTGRTLDALTVPTLVGMAIGRVGCFLSGCCAGTATSLPWAVRDAEGHSVHPVQLYEGAADLLLVGFLNRVMRDRTPGARIHAATLGYSGIRFVTEFARAGRTLHGGLNLVQWSMLVIGVGLAIATVMRAPQAMAVVARVRDRAPVTAVVLVVLLITLTISTGAWLQPLEQLALLLLAGGVTATGVLAAIDLWIPGMRAALGPLTLAPRLGALFIIQAPVEQTVPRRELIIGSSLARGAYEQVVGESLDDTGCGGIPTIAHRERTIVTTTLGVRQLLEGGSHLTIEAQVLAGHDKLRSLSAGPTDFTPSSATLFGGGAGITLERPTGSVRLGMLGGHLSAPGQKSGVALTSTVRLGDDRRFFSEFNLANPNLGATLGEFSYFGLGFTGGRDRARGLVGLGAGALIGVHIPVRSFEVDVAVRSFVGEEGGDGRNFWSIGLRRALGPR